jgi:hypothetical protein
MRLVDRWTAGQQDGRGWSRDAGSDAGTAGSFMSESGGGTGGGCASDDRKNDNELRIAFSGGGLGVDLGDDRVGGLAVERSGHANLKFSSDVVGAQAVGDGLSFVVGLDGKHFGVVGECAAGTIVGELKDDRSVDDGLAVFVQNLNDRLFSAVLMDVVDGALAFLDDDFDFRSLGVGGRSQHAENYQRAQKAVNYSCGLHHGLRMLSNLRA